MNPEPGERIARALERIADVLELLVDQGLPEAAAELQGCAHPDDQRVSLGITAGQHDWLCRNCGYRSVPDGSESTHG